MKAKTTAEGLEQSRQIIRTQAAASTELEALRLVAATSRELEDASAELFLVLDELLTPELVLRVTKGGKDPRPGPDRILDELAGYEASGETIDRFMSARSANEIALHRWEWWVWNADGSRGGRRT